MAALFYFLWFTGLDSTGSWRHVTQIASHWLGSLKINMYKLLIFFFKKKKTPAKRVKNMFFFNAFVDPHRFIPLLVFLKKVPIHAALAKGGEKEVL